MQVEALLDEGLPLHQRDASGQTALLAATEKGRVETVELLLKRGADPTMSDKLGFAAMHAAVALKEQGEDGGDAARGARMRLVTLLLAQGADLNQGDALAFSPLHVRPRPCLPQCIFSLVLESQLPHQIVNLIFQLVIVHIKLTVLWGESTF